MNDEAQNQVKVSAGVASEEDKRRRLIMEIEDSLEHKDELDDDEKEGVLDKLKLVTMVELEKTRRELVKEGKAAIEDQKKQEEGTE